MAGSRRLPLYHDTCLSSISSSTHTIRWHTDTTAQSSAFLPILGQCNCAFRVLQTYCSDMSSLLKGNCRCNMSEALNHHQSLLFFCDWCTGAKLLLSLNWLKHESHVQQNIYFVNDSISVY